MPRYFFYVHDGAEFPDAEGTELADISQAQSEAVRMAGEILRDMGRFWSGESWRLEVTDAAGRKLFQIDFTAREFPQD